MSMCGLGSTWGLISQATLAMLDGLENEHLRQRISEVTASAGPRDPVHVRRARASRCFALFGTDLGVGAIYDNAKIRQVQGVNVTADIIVPHGDGPHPVLVYLHGGAFITGCSRDYRNVALRFAEAGILVCNINYRLAPEHRFPAGYDDCVEAVRWVANIVSTYGGDPSSIAVGGDSAGANLAAAVAVNLADEVGSPRIAATILLYGIYDNATMLLDESNADEWRGILDYYLGEGTDADIDDTRLNPLRSAYKLPPTFIMVGSKDALCIQQSAQLSSALREAAVPHRYKVMDGLPHGFISLEVLYPNVRDAIYEMAGFLLNLHSSHAATP